MKFKPFLLQWCGMGLTSFATSNWIVAISDEPAPKTVKNLLKSSGILWGIAAAQTFYNAENGWERKDVAYPAVVGQAALAGLCLWRGYSDEE